MGPDAALGADRREYRCPPCWTPLVLASVSETLVNETAKFVGEAGLPGIFALMALSSACIPIPSEVVMLFAGFAVADPAQAGDHPSHDPLGIVLAGVLGTIVGSWVAYGRRAGWAAGAVRTPRRRASTWARRRSRRPTAGSTATASRWWLFGRVIPVVRAFVSLPAGIARMPVVRFTVYSLIGTVFWVIPLALAGEALGSDWKTARKAFEWVDYVLLAADRGRDRLPDRAPPAGTKAPRHRCGGLSGRCRYDTPSPWACCRGPRSCCRSPPRPTRRWCRGSPAGTTTSSTTSCARASRWPSTAAPRRPWRCWRDRSWPPTRAALWRSRPARAGARPRAPGARGPGPRAGRIERDLGGPRAIALALAAGSAGMLRRPEAAAPTAAPGAALGRGARREDGLAARSRPGRSR